MKITSKRLVSILLCLAFALALLPLAAFAEQPETLYLVPNINWRDAGARFAAYFYGDNGDTWADAVDSNGDGICEVVVPQGYTNVIFCRMNPNAAENNWDNKWNQTSDLPIPEDGTDCYAVAAGTWDKGGGTWSTFIPGSVGEPDTRAPLSIESIIAVGAGSGNFLNGAEWDPSCEANVMTKNNDVYTITYEGVAAGTYEYKFAANNSWADSWGADTNTYSGETYDAWYNGGNCILEITEDNSTVTLILDLSNLNSDGSGAKCSVEVVVPEPAVEPAVKWQITSGTNADSDSTELRLVTYVDSLDYQSVTFNMTADGETVNVACDTVYEAIKVDGVLISNPAEVFGNEAAAYFVTYTVTEVGNINFDTEITLSVTWTDLEGNESTSEARTIVISSLWAE